MLFRQKNSMRIERIDGICLRRNYAGDAELFGVGCRDLNGCSVARRWIEVVNTGMNLRGIGSFGSKCISDGGSVEVYRLDIEERHIASHAGMSFWRIRICGGAQ